MVKLIRFPTSTNQKDIELLHPNRFPTSISSYDLSTNNYLFQGIIQKILFYYSKKKQEKINKYLIYLNKKHPDMKFPDKLIK